MDEPWILKCSKCKERIVSQHDHYLICPENQETGFRRDFGHATMIFTDRLWGIMWSETEINKYQIKRVLKVEDETEI